jgi:opacity protein-like surface antigen
VDNLFAGTAQTGIDLSAGTFTYATGSTVNFGNDLKAKTTTYNTALTAKDTATAAKTTATGYQTAFVTHYTNNITGAKATFDAIAETDGVKKHAAAIDAAEHSELGLNASGTKSKSKSGFIAEAVVGYDHRMSDVMVGVDLGIGFDTFKTTIKDKSPATASTTTTKNGVEVKRPFYVLVLPRVGYMFTPQLEGYITAGVSLNRYKVDTRGMAVVHDKYNALVTQGKALNTLRTTKITELTAKIANTSTSADDKKKAEADLKIYTDSPIITGLKTDEVNAAQQKVHKKTKLAPVVGAGVRFAVTPDVLIGLGYRYQFKTKLVDFEKTGNVKVDDQSHTFKFDVLFRIGD